jgi:Ca2+-binding RTX toxin-like protein
VATVDPLVAGSGEIATGTTRSGIHSTPFARGRRRCRTGGALTCGSAVTNQPLSDQPGADTIDGKGGDDVICGGDGNDWIDGGAGTDTCTSGEVRMSSCEL